MSTNSKELEQIHDELDKIFEWVIIFLGILSAALFQFVSSIIPLRYNQVTQASDMIAAYSKNFRIIFVPLLIVVFLWIANRVFFEKKVSFGRRSIAQFCFNWAIITAFVDIIYYLILVFPTLSADELWFTFFFVFGLTLAMQIVISWRYEHIKILSDKAWLKLLVIVIMAWSIYLIVFRSL